MKIAFFDSGIGGLTVLNEAIRLFPNEDYLYFADSCFAPYGSRSLQEVETLIIDAVNFLSSKDIDILVLACHTASRLMGEKLRSRLYPFEIIDMHSGIVSPPAIDVGKKNLVCATDLSINIWKEQLSNSSIKADYLSLQELVIFAENLEFDSFELFEYLRWKFTDTNWNNYHSVILGCTHFPFFKNQIKSILPKSVQVRDGSLETTNRLRTYIQKAPKDIEYFISKTSTDTTVLHKYLEALDTSYQPMGAFV